jgi:hypothetical protein
MRTGILRRSHALENLTSGHTGAKYGETKGARLLKVEAAVT